MEAYTEWQKAIDNSVLGTVYGGTPMKSRHLIEVLTPKQSSPDFEAELYEFANRYNTVIESGHVVSVPDNPMGSVHFQVT